MGLQELRKQLDEKQIGAVELTNQYLEKIEKTDKTINSYITVCAEEALKDAENAQKMIDEGKQSFLTGIPLSVKDNICTLGVKTTCASKMLEDFVPVYDATVMQKLRGEGIVMLGKTRLLIRQCF